MQLHRFSKKNYRRLSIKTLIAATFGVLLYIHHHFHPFIPKLESHHGQAIWLSIGATACIICFYCGSYIFRTAWTAFKSTDTNKNTLIAIGTLVLLIYSFLRALFPQQLQPLFIDSYFVSAVLIVALSNFATLIEDKAKATNRVFLSRLQHLLPKQVVRINDNDNNMIDSADIQVGDILRTEPGEIIAADGYILNGETKVSLRKLTGEPIPRRKKPGDLVLAGSVNKSEVIDYQVRYAGKNTALRQIIQTVKTSQFSQTRKGKRLDLFTAIYVPSILLISMLVMLLWFNFGPAPHYVHGMLRLVTTLVIVSPTALALSIPLAIIMGIGKAAEYGILVSNAQTAMKAAKVNTIIFDKSGIITQGKPHVMHVISHHEAWTEQKLLQYAASIENRYEHPFANAIVAEANTRNIELLPVTDVAIKPGLGATAVCDNETYIIGNRKYMRELNIDLNGYEETAERLAQHGNSILLLASPEKVFGLVALRDKPRREARDAIARIKSLGIRTVMFTADNRRAAENLARRLGIDNVFADISTEGKINEIKRFQKKGKHVALVSEGATDTAALSQANISIAVATNEHILLETADINLMRDSLHGIADTVIISRATRKKLKQNMIFSIIYNLLGLTFAAGAFYPLWHFLIRPTEATILTTLMSLFTVYNSNRLMHLKPFKVGRLKS